MAALKAQQDQLTSIMKVFGEAKEGDVVTLDFVDGATVVGFNGAARGTIPGESFNKALTKIWLGDKPVQGDLRRRCWAADRIGRPPWRGPMRGGLRMRQRAARMGPRRWARRGGH